MDKQQADKILERSNMEGENVKELHVNSKEGQGLTGKGLGRSQSGHLTIPHKRGSADIHVDEKIPDGQHKVKLDDGREATRKH